MNELNDDQKKQNEIPGYTMPHDKSEGEKGGQSEVDTDTDLGTNPDFMSEIDSEDIQPKVTGQDLNADVIE